MTNNCMYLNVGKFGYCIDGQNSLGKTYSTSRVFFPEDLQDAINETMGESYRKNYFFKIRAAEAAIKYFEKGGEFILSNMKFNDDQSSIFIMKYLSDPIYSKYTYQEKYHIASTYLYIMQKLFS